MKNREIEKKAKEKIILDLILDKLNVSNVNFISLSGPNEPPDFINHDLKIGIEITKYHRSKKYKEMDKYLFDLIEEYKNKYILQHNGKKSLDIYFREENFYDLIKEKSKKDIHKEIFDYLLNTVLKYENDLSEIEIENIDLDDFFKDYISCIDIYLDENRTDIIWQECRADIIDIKIDVLKNIIKIKENIIFKNFKYQNCEKWLFIYSTSGKCIGFPRKEDSFSSCGSITNEVLNYKFNSKFDKIIYYDGWKNNIFELK